MQAFDRAPDSKKIANDKAGVAMTDRGFTNVDIQMRTNVPHISASGDIVGTHAQLFVPNSPELAAARMHREVEKWARVIERLGLKAEWTLSAPATPSHPRCPATAPSARLTLTQLPSISYPMKCMEIGLGTPAV